MATIYTQAGCDLMANLLDKTTAVPNWFIGWGTGAAAAAKADTALGTAAPEARVAATMSQPAAGENQFAGTLTAAAPETITEAGVFDASAAGTLFIHASFAGVALAAGDSIALTFQLTHA